MMNKILMAVAVLAFCGCAATMNRSAPAESMSAAGPIRPCASDSGDTRSCGNAFFNTAVISQIHIGQTQSEVRVIMRHGAERREIAGATESWGYITSYANKMMTWITFTNHTVSSLSHEVLERD
ncbi:MAG: hypothetical protein ACXVIJ_05890 [Thermoanaerobaculia bacterium]